MKTTTPSSKCCKATFHVQGSDEGTNYYVCDKCGEPCDLIYIECRQCGSVNGDHLANCPNSPRKTQNVNTSPTPEKQGERKCKCGHEAFRHLLNTGRSDFIYDGSACISCTCPQYNPTTSPQPSPVTEEECKNHGVDIIESWTHDRYESFCRNCGRCVNVNVRESTTIPADGGWEEDFREKFTSKNDSRFWKTNIFGEPPDPDEIEPFIRQAISTAVEEKEREWRDRVEHMLRHAEQDIREITAKIASNIIGGENDVGELEDHFLKGLQTYLINPYDKDEKDEETAE